MGILLSLVCGQGGMAEDLDVPAHLAGLAPVEYGPGVSVKDLLRGFTDVELQAAERAVPERPEPPPGTPVPRGVTVSGSVFVDTNGNGMRDAEEPGLADVPVTDGEAVIRTGADGKYAFAFRMDGEAHCRFAVATRPTGFRPTSPFFLRIPFAEGRTEYRADFGFAPDARSRRRAFSFLVASDSQFTQLEEMVAIAKDYAQMTGGADGDPAFLVTVGDLTMSGTHRQWDMYDRIRGASKIPLYEGFGGHDGNCLDPRSTANYELRIGPPYYAWDYGGVHFVQFVTERAYLGERAAARQQAWLEADLGAVPEGTPVVVVTHYPMPAAWFDRKRAEGLQVICQLAGHWHAVQAGSRGDVPVLICAPARGRDWGAYSRAYCRMEVTPEGVQSRVRIAGQYRRLDVVAPGGTAALGPQPLLVLAYDSVRNVASVTCRATGPDGRAQSIALAPHGGWSWQGRFAPDAPGTWRIELRATDATGAVWERQRSIRVADVQPADPEAGADFPWVLAGDPPRRVAEGPGAPLFPLWVVQTGSAHVLHASPAVAGGRVYVAVANPNVGGDAPGGGILCLDAETGREVWRAASPRGDIRGCVTVHDGRVYTVTGEGWAAAFDAETGRMLWSRPLKPEYADGRPLALNRAPPVPTRFGLLVSDWQAPQFLLDYATGAEQAELEMNVGHYAAFATVFEDVMYCARRGGRLALRLPSGDAVWEGEETDRSTSAGIVVDGMFLYTCSSGIKALDAATGEMIWETAVANAGFQKPVPVVWDDLVLVNGSDFTALDRGTGEMRWTVPCARDPERFARSQRQAMAGSSTPLVAGDLAYFGHDDASIRAVDRQGRIVWEHRLGTPIKTAPAVSGNLLFVHDYAGNLWCFAP